MTPWERSTTHPRYCDAQMHGRCWYMRHVTSRSEKNDTARLNGCDGPAAFRHVTSRSEKDDIAGLNRCEGPAAFRHVTSRSKENDTARLNGCAGCVAHGRGAPVDFDGLAGALAGQQLSIALVDQSSHPVWHSPLHLSCMPIITFDLIGKIAAASERACACGNQERSICHACRS